MNFEYSHCCRKLAQASSMDAEGRDNDVSFAQRKDQEDVSMALLIIYMRSDVFRMCRDYYKGSFPDPPPPKIVKNIFYIPSSNLLFCGY